MSTWIAIMVLVLEIPLIALILMGLRYLFQKGKLELSEREWNLVQEAVKEGVLYVEQHCLKLQKEGKPKLKPEEKMELATGLIDKALGRLKLAKYKPLVMPLIEAKLYQLFKEPVTV